MIDLHVHSNYSDGLYSPTDLIRMASERGINTISITDHDTIQAYSSDIIKFAKDLGIRLIPGIELSTVDEESGEKIHVVGLNINIHNVNLVALCEKIQQKRREAVILTEQKLNQYGIILRSYDLLKTNSTITKSMIAKNVIENPNNRASLIDIYGDLPQQGVFIEDYLLPGKPAYIGDDLDQLNTRKAVEIVKLAGGKAICAHPSFNVMRGFRFEQMQQLIMRNKFDGVECINIQYDKSKGDVRVDMVDQFLRLAENNNLLVSGGSDFHSNDYSLWGNHSDFGLANERYMLTEQQVSLILS